MIKQNDTNTTETINSAFIKLTTVPLSAALSSMSSTEEMERFLTDLLTPAERTALEERWQIAQLLAKGNATYRDIAAETGASTTTVTRVARFLFNERHQGYRMILDRLSNT